MRTSWHRLPEATGFLWPWFGASPKLLNMSEDPVQTNPDHYTVVFENDRVRVLEYRDKPGHRSTMHIHPDSVMITASTDRKSVV